MSSGRLPSPPPAPEIQLTPDDQDAFGSPARHGRPGGHSELDQQVVEHNSRRRIHPGTKAAEMETGPPLVPLDEINSSFRLQEHLAALHHHHTEQGKQALTRTAAIQIAQTPPTVEDQAWIYELCRFLIAECNKLIVGFLFDTPPCSASTCPEMRASEWQFLCAVHEQPKSCCAIDYCCHTLDWAANVVTDPRTFPSRLAPLGDGSDELDIGKSDPPPSVHAISKNLVNVFRRVHRIFAHAWFQHRSVFWAVEAQSGLYLLFKVVCDAHKLLPGETYRLPPEAEGLDGAAQPAAADQAGEKAFASGFKPLSVPRRGEDEDPLNHSPVSRTNTRRHRSSPSTGSSVTTVIEADEEGSPGSSRGRLGGIRTRVSEVSPSRLEPYDEGEEMASVPVIVEHVEHSYPRDAPEDSGSSPFPQDDFPKDDDAVTTILDEESDDQDMEGDKSTVIGPSSDTATKEEAEIGGAPETAADPEEAAPVPVPAEHDSEAESSVDTPESSVHDSVNEAGEDSTEVSEASEQVALDDKPAETTEATEATEKATSEAAEPEITSDEAEDESTADKKAGEDKAEEAEAVEAKTEEAKTEEVNGDEGKAEEAKADDVPSQEADKS